MQVEVLLVQCKAAECAHHKCESPEVILHSVWAHPTSKTQRAPRAHVATLQRLELSVPLSMGAQIPRNATFGTEDRLTSVRPVSLFAQLCAARPKIANPPPRRDLTFCRDGWTDKPKRPLRARRLGILQLALPRFWLEFLRRCRRDDASRTKGAGVSYNVLACQQKDSNESRPSRAYLLTHLRASLTCHARAARAAKRSAAPSAYLAPRTGVRASVGLGCPGCSWLLLVE